MILSAPLSYSDLSSPRNPKPRVQNDPLCSIEVLQSTKRNGLPLCLGKESLASLTPTGFLPVGWQRSHTPIRLGWLAWKLPGPACVFLPDTDITSASYYLCALTYTQSTEFTADYSNAVAPGRLITSVGAGKTSIEPAVMSPRLRSPDPKSSSLNRLCHKKKTVEKNMRERSVG